ncbi:hypothetical protein GK091_24360 [Spirosoma agri]|uniref:Squalene cyclase C-terminal domain-containing protein n=1 Tax=Spirosoma agri TaxID=1987381 RepID=A0A6M0IP45_9BACT|nr:hypothetical protein [Spirosoma agri]NEU70036.1 hypothetical protein [Spirosoma agri]
MDARSINETGAIPVIQIEQAINRGVDYLYKHQYPNGEFCCYTSPDLRMQKACVPDSAVFPAAVIASTLLGLAGHPKVDALLKKTVPFFQYQMMRGGICNYYTLRSPLFKLNPPDIDTTAYVGTLFDVWRIEYPRESTRTLMLINQRSKGGIYTWFILRFRPTVNRIAWRTGLRGLKSPLASLRFWLKHEYKRNDVGGVVNANALYYLGVTEATRSTLDYLIQIVKKGEEVHCDSWYRSPINFYYALGRNYYKGVWELESVRSIVLERLMNHQQPDGSFGDNLLETAQALSTLIYWQGHPAVAERTARVLLAHQGKYGEWPRAIFFYRGPGKTVGWGSEEITTGFCVEALNAYQNWAKKMDTDNRINNTALKDYEASK